MQKAPLFFLTAVGASRVVGGPPGPGVPLLLIFHSQSGATTAHNINAAARALYPAVEQLQIASIVDLRRVPRFMRAVVEPILLAAYRSAAAHVPHKLDPGEYVLIAPDWDGKVTNNFGMSDRANDVGILLISHAWQICNRYIGDDPQSAALAMLAEYVNAASGVSVESATQL